MDLSDCDKHFTCVDANYFLHSRFTYPQLHAARICVGDNHRRRLHC